MKKIIDVITTIIIFGILIFVIYINKDKFVDIYNAYIAKEIKQDLKDNDYRKKENYEFVQINENTTVKSTEDIKNSIYTYLDAGWNTYTFKCDKEYQACETEIKMMVDNNSYLTEISNFVHPFNTFNKFNTKMSKGGTITIDKVNRYSDDEISKINEKVDEIYNANYDKTKTVKENIMIFHDYIVNNTKYDTSYNKNEINNTSPSSNAYGVLFSGVGICSGYTDAMQLFLEKLNVKNIRISSSTHEWNLVFIEGKWKHLDLTWDGPVINEGKEEIVSHDYFLIDTNELLSKKDGEHDFDKDVYKEALN